MPDRIAELEAALATTRAEINAAWDYIRNGYDIEDREWLEKRYGGGRCGANTYPLQMAIHYLHKRDAKAAPIRQAAREEFAERLKYWVYGLPTHEIDSILAEMKKADRG